MLDPDEPPPFEVVNADARGDVFLICDHASHRLPRRLGDLGLEPGQITQHIGWDIGAAKVARRLSELLDAPLVLSGYSRLAIDCNRPPGALTSVVEVSGGVTIPGNASVGADDRKAREDSLFWPYHHAITALLDRRPPPRALLSMHSFTPDFPGQVRPWPIAMLHGHDRRLAGLLIDELTAQGWLVGDNEPYRVTDGGDYGVPVYGEKRQTPAVLVEVRQDGVGTDEGALLWADRLAAAYRAVAHLLPSPPAAWPARRDRFSTGG